MKKFAFKIADNLRETPLDSKQFSKDLKELEARIKIEKSLNEQAVLLSKIGVLSRINGDIDKSETYLNEAEILITKLDNKRLELVNKIRILQTLQFKGEFKKCLKKYPVLEVKIKGITKLKALLDFLYQHWAKCLFETNSFAEAEKYFKLALKLRKEKGDEELLKSTQFALDVLSKKLYLFLSKKTQ